MLGILIYVIAHPKLGLKDIYPKMQAGHFFALFGFCLGFYDGFFGPVTGSLWIFSLVYFLGFNLARASAYAKIFNLKSNLMAFVWFSWFHQVDFHAGLIMAVGQLIGGFLGARLVIYKGAHFVRPFYLLAVSAMVIFLFYNSSSGSE
mgnify:CR=1 FL=1